MLSNEQALTATGRVPRPLLRFEERFLLQDMKKSGLGGIRAGGKTLLAFAAAWSRLQHEEPGWPTDPADQKFQANLLAWLKFHRAMLIGELIPEGIKYLRLNAHSPYRSKFEHVLVDEYQDLNRAEQQLIEYLANGNLVVIGDEDQSIYSFKHAHPEGIVEFPETHPATEEAGLYECRRCPHRVVAMANALIRHNQSRSDRQLKPFPGNPEGEIYLVQWPNMAAEAAGIAQFVKARTDSGSVTPGSVLVLAPRREFGYLVRDKLIEAGVSAHSFFSEELLDGDPKDVGASRAQQSLALLTLLSDPDDRVALRCWCGFGSASLADGAWARLRAHCEASGDSPRQALEKLAAGTLKLANSNHLLARFAELKAETARADGLRGQALVEAVFPVAQEWAAPFAEISGSIEEDDFGPDKLGAVIRRSVSQPEMPAHVDYVRVMSLHKSKGLTADLVVVCGCLDGLIPTTDEGATPEEQQRAVEEQRRLFYVAITRTRKTLVLSSVASISSALAFRMRARTSAIVGDAARTVTSGFVHELGAECPAAITGARFLALAVGEDA
jgi:superfamily I DNA/RNA helicase